MSSIDSLLHQLSSEEHTKIFNTRIKSSVFKNVPSTQSPRAIIFGGQPGAGKTALAKHSVEKLIPSGKPVLIDGDVMRTFHPEHDKLSSENDKTASALIHHDASLWIEDALAYACTLKCNIAIERTMHSPEKLLKIVHSLREAGYSIEVWALAVPEKLSWQSVLYRYEDQKTTDNFARMVPHEIHQAAYHGMLETIEKVENQKLVDKICVYKRGGYVLYENTLSQEKWEKPPMAREIIEEERNRPWREEEHRAYTEIFDKIYEMITRFERKASLEDIEGIQGLRAIAYQELNEKIDHFDASKIKKEEIS